MTLCPNLTIGAIECDVENSKFCQNLWDDIKVVCDIIQKTKIEDVKKNINIAATRTAYKATGKDPNRYRPSAESLRRRIIRGLGLYKISTLVDLINLVSLKTGFSIGGFNAEAIKGDLILTIGEKDDVFYGIGRGKLNIEGLPVYKDSIGGIGTPTSDEERTKINDDTSKLLMLINGYSGKEYLPDSIEYSLDLLTKYANATNINVRYI